MSDANWSAARLDVKPGSTPEQAAEAVKKALGSLSWHQWTEQPTNGAAMTPSNPTSADIREVIAHMKTLADMFPGVIHAANGSGLNGSPMNTMGAIDRACEMLRRHSDDVAEIERKRADDQAHESRTLAYDLAFEEGVQSEKNRAKEARKGRKRGAKKS